MGKDSFRENSPNFIDEALGRGFDCEIDLWGAGAVLHLGHDAPQFAVELGWLRDRADNLWVHCKNHDAIVAVHEQPLNWFFHENDAYTLTSRGFIWAFPGQPVVGSNTVSLWFGDADPTDEEAVKESWGICGDFVGAWK